MKTKLSRVYKTSELTEKDIEFFNENEFCCICSNDLNEISNNPASCARGVVVLVSDDAFGCSTIFEDITKDGFCYGGYSFDVTPFKYVRVAINPYGNDEFSGIPSEN